MQGLTGWFTGSSAPDREPTPSSSVLSEWNSYAGKPNTSGTLATDNLLASAEEGASSIGNLVTSALTSVAAAATGAATSVNVTVQNNVPGTTQWVYFAALAGTGTLFLLLAFFIFLPMIILVPSKFAITFSLGSALIIASLGALKGWSQMFGHMASKERLPYTAGYIGSLIATLYSSLILQSYVFSLLSCVAQLATLVIYVASFFPGGASGAQYVFGTVGRGTLSLGGAMLRGVLSK